jgi:IS5 family transposase
MKAHIGTDPRGIVHSLVTTAANVSDISQMAHLLHGQEREVYGDQAYWSEVHRQGARSRCALSDQSARDRAPSAFPQRADNQPHPFGHPGSR